MKRHRTDTVSLIFGLIFLLTALWWLTNGSVNIGLPAFGWILAGLLIVIGAIGLIGALRSNREPARRDGGTD
jgi:hypothetical protein